MNIFRKIKQKLKLETDQNLDFLSKKYVDFVIKQDILKKAMVDRKKINELYDAIVPNYIKIMEYIIYDFNITQHEDTDLIEDLNIVKTECLQYLNKHNIAPDKVVFKLRVINIAIDEYPPMVDLLRKLCHQKRYRDIDFMKENETIKEAELLKTDFSILQSIKNDIPTEPTQEAVHG